MPWRGWAGPWSGTYVTAMEGSLRVPFIIRWPGKVPVGRVSNEMMHEVDLYTPRSTRAAATRISTTRQGANFRRCSVSRTTAKLLSSFRSSRSTRHAWRWRWPGTTVRVATLQGGSGWVRNELRGSRWTKQPPHRGLSSNSDWPKFHSGNMNFTCARSCRFWPLLIFGAFRSHLPSPRGRLNVSQAFQPAGRLLASNSQ